jgi:hypothetical protein
MTSGPKDIRKLPMLILDPANDPGNWEPKAVVAKFGKSDAVIGEDNVDYVALGYMNPGAVLFWLPRFFAYMREKAGPASFHLESIISHLSNSALVSQLRQDATEDDVKQVSDFLVWLGTQPIMVNAPPLRATAYAYAAELWRS